MHTLAEVIHINFKSFLCDIGKCRFLNRVTDKWNQLCEDIVTYTSVNSSKNRLNHFMHKRGLYKSVKGCLSPSKFCW